jgi:hypothetical protein
VHASQVPGSRFFDALAFSNWRLRPRERLKPVVEVFGACFKEPLVPPPMAVQLFNPECPSTQSTVAVPAWLFNGMGGFDRSSQLPDTNDFVQRVQMMDPEVPVDTWTDASIAGCDIAEVEDHIARAVKQLDPKYGGKEYKEMMKELREQNTSKRHRGEVIRNKPAGVRRGTEFVSLSGLHACGTVECPSDPHPGAIDQDLLVEDASVGGAVSDEQIAARFLQEPVNAWLQALAKWTAVAYLQDAQVDSQLLQDPQPISQLSNMMDFPSLAKSDPPAAKKADPPAAKKAPRSTASSSPNWSSIGHSLYNRSPKLEVKFWTWGRKRLHTISPYDALPAVAWMPREGKFCEVLSGRALQAVIKSDDVPMVFNCRVFHEDDKTLKASPSWGHCGIHPANIERLIAHWKMEEFAKLLCRKVIHWLAARPSLECLHIGLECNQGRDRSVGMSVLLRHLFGLAGCNVAVVHICKENWRSNDACKSAARMMRNARNPNAPCPDCQTRGSYEMARNAAKSVDGFAELLSVLQK